MQVGKVPGPFHAVLARVACVWWSFTSTSPAVDGVSQLTISQVVVCTIRVRVALIIESVWAVCVPLVITQHCLPARLFTWPRGSVFIKTMNNRGACAFFFRHLSAHYLCFEALGLMACSHYTALYLIFSSVKTPRGVTSSGVWDMRRTELLKQCCSKASLCNPLADVCSALDIITSGFNVSCVEWCQLYILRELGGNLMH